MADDYGPAITQALDDTRNYQDAVQKLGLNAQEQNLYKHHLDEIMRMGSNDEGATSTVRQLGIEHNGRQYNIPTIYNGEILKPEDAIKRAMPRIDKYPSYKDADEAEARYQLMHDYMEKDIRHGR